MCNARLTDLNLELQLLLMGPVAIVELGCQFDGVAKVTDGLLIRRAGQCLGARLSPVLDGLPSLARPARMMSQYLRRSVGIVFQATQDIRMQSPAPGVQQALVGRVAHQHVLENMGRSRAASKYQLGSDQSFERGCELRRLERQHPAKKGGLEAATYAGGRLRHLFQQRLETVEACHQRVV